MLTDLEKHTCKQFDYRHLQVYFLANYEFFSTLYEFFSTFRHLNYEKFSTLVIIYELF